MLADTPLDIHAAESAGGVRGEALFLPVSMDWADDAENNAAAYVFRVAWAVASRDAGFLLPRNAQCEFERDLATLLAVPQTVNLLERRWPGARALRQKLSAQLRPLPTGTAPLECLESALLGALAPEMASRHAPATLAWVRHVLASPPEPSDLADAVAAATAAADKLPRGRGRSRTRLWLWGRLFAESNADADEIASLADAVCADALPTGTECPAKPREETNRRQPSAQRDGDNPLTHVFEKLFTAEEYQGGDRRLDGADELDEHAEALDELELRHVVQSAEPTASIYRADLPGAGTAPDLAGDPIADDGNRLHYDEWDGMRRAYRPRWCTLLAERPAPTLTAGRVAQHVGSVRRRYARQIRQLRASFDRLERRRAPRNRQRSGNDVDIDAVVDRRASLLAAERGEGHAACDRLYISRRPHRPAVATLVLLDASLSTDAWVAGRRVIDVARDAVLVLGEVMEGRRFDVAIGAFHSNSRTDCRYLRVKDFDDGWSAALSRLLGLRPTGYTRVGPALRHATSVLRSSSARRKLLLLVSDGKPTDYDHYEGKHGVADVRQALREAHRDRVATFALAIAEGASQHLPPMFGRGGYEILADPRHLPDSLVRLHERLCV
ncbi:MAG: VWA domain-containing protein [Planctomycetota bacterium]